MAILKIYATFWSPERHKGVKFVLGNEGKSLDSKLDLIVPFRSQVYLFLNL